MTSGYKISKELAKVIITEAWVFPSMENRMMIVDTALANNPGIYINQKDWRKPFVDY